MKVVGAYEAKTRLPALLGDVARGQRITITRHGLPVAMLIPVGAIPSQEPKDIADGWRRYREERQIRLGPDLTLRDMIDQGRAQ